MRKRYEKIDHNPEIESSWVAMLTYGEWCLQAHGQCSHDKVVNGYYLVTEIAGKDDAQFVALVEAYYIGCLGDYQKHLAISPRFYAMLYGDFGYSESTNPVLNSATINRNLMQEYSQLGLSSWGNLQNQNSMKGYPYGLARFSQVGGQTCNQFVKAICSYRIYGSPKEEKYNEDK